MLGGALSTKTTLKAVSTLALRHPYNSNDCNKFVSGFMNANWPAQFEKGQISAVKRFIVQVPLVACGQQLFPDI